jgi:DMSO/TMAO reductase YedYZ molybdopterin-dependent catalytic subunit
MRDVSRRRYLKYMFGFVISIGALSAVAYLGLRDDLFKRKGIPIEESMTTRSTIPPGQHEIKQLQVLHVGSIPKFDPATWTYEVFGLVNKPFVLTWSEFRNLSEIETLSDFHCVTGWSKLDNRWGGVQFKRIYEMAEPTDDAHYATMICDGGYTTSLPLRELLDNDVLFAFRLDGRELEPQLGGPLRIVVPKKYAYKSAKWVRKVKFTERQELGYWELRGYSNTADPWAEDRYSV